MRSVSDKRCRDYQKAHFVLNSFFPPKIVPFKIMWKKYCTARQITDGFHRSLRNWYDMIYLLTAIGLSHGGSSTVHIYTQTIHRTIQNKEYIEQHNNFVIVGFPYRTCFMSPLWCLEFGDGSYMNVNFLDPSVIASRWCLFCIAKFYIWLTVHHVMMFGKWPTWCKNSFVCIYFYF